MWLLRIERSFPEDPHGADPMAQRLDGTGRVPVAIGSGFGRGAGLASGKGWI